MPASTKTVSDIVTQSLKEIGIIRDNQTISAQQLTDGLTLLNQMMAEWEADGIELGYYLQDAGTDVVPVEQSAESGVMYNLAVRYAGQFGAPIQASTAMMASKTLQKLEKATVGIVEADMTHLPVSSSYGYNINTDE